MKKIFKKNLKELFSFLKIPKSTFGPFGADKIIFKKIYDYQITNDGYRILKEISKDLKNPLISLFMTHLENYEKKCGDGTTIFTIYFYEFFKTMIEIKKNLKNRILFEFLKKFQKVYIEELTRRSFRIMEEEKLFLLPTLGKISESHQNLFRKIFINLKKEINFNSKNLIEVWEDYDGEIEDSKIEKGIIIEKNYEDYIFGGKKEIFLLNFHFDDVSLIQNFSKDSILINEREFSEEVEEILKIKKISFLKNVLFSRLEKIKDILSLPILKNLKNLKKRDIKVNVIDHSEYLIIRNNSINSLIIILSSKNKIFLEEMKENIRDSLKNYLNYRKNPKVISGGCSFEISFQYSEKKLSEEYFFREMKEAVKRVARTLFINSGIDSIIEFEKIKKKLKKKVSFYNFKVNKIEEKMENMIYDPINSRVVLIEEIIKLINQILRIDEMYIRK